MVFHLKCSQKVTRFSRNPAREDAQLCTLSPTAAVPISTVGFREISSRWRCVFFPTKMSCYHHSRRGRKLPIMVVLACCFCSALFGDLILGASPSPHSPHLGVAVVCLHIVLGGRRTPP